MAAPTSLKLRVGVDMKNDGRTHDLTARQWVDCARYAEECGFESVWINEDVGHDTLIILSLAAQATSRILVGTAISNVFHRSAMQMAMGAATLDEVSDGRARIALSSGHHPWNDLHHGIPIEKPLSRVREYLTFMNKALTGEPFQHEGAIFHGVHGRLAFRPPRHIPIYVGGTLPGMIQLAGAQSDGLLTNVVPASYIASFAAEHMAQSAREAGRDPGQLELTAIVTCCVSDDPDEALANAKETFLWRQSMNAERLRKTFAPEFHDELARLAALSGEGKLEQAKRDASPELVTSVIANGSPAQVWQQVQKYFDAGATRVVLAPYPRDEQHVKSMLAALAPHVSSTVPAAIS